MVGVSRNEIASVLHKMSFKRQILPCDSAIPGKVNYRHQLGPPQRWLMEKKRILVRRRKKMSWLLAQVLLSHTACLCMEVPS